MYEKCRLLGHNHAYEGIDNISQIDHQDNTTEGTSYIDGYLQPVASNRHIVPHMYDEVKEPYEELSHQSTVRDGVIDYFYNKS